MKIKYKVLLPDGEARIEKLNCEDHGLTEMLLNQMQYNYRQKLIMELIHREVRERYGQKCEVELI